MTYNKNKYILGFLSYMLVGKLQMFLMDWYSCRFDYTSMLGSGESKDHVRVTLPP